MVQRFRGEYFFLSNFAPTPFTYGAWNYPTAEHAYQAEKAVEGADALWVMNASSAAEAKRRGRLIEKRMDWDEVKIEIMEKILKAKFSLPSLKSKLLATGEDELIEGNNHGDTFWGVCNGIGRNMLGQLLMKVRSEIRDAERSR